jgi:hypothetical protein
MTLGPVSVCLYWAACWAQAGRSGRVELVCREVQRVNYLSYSCVEGRGAAGPNLTSDGAPILLYPSLTIYHWTFGQARIFYLFRYLCPGLLSLSGMYQFAGSVVVSEPPSINVPSTSVHAEVDVESQVQLIDTSNIRKMDHNITTAKTDHSEFAHLNY